MVPKLKTFIEEHIDLIEEKSWQALYSYAQAEIPFQIGNLSYNLIEAGINPLEDLNRVLPEMFCDASELSEIELPENITKIMRQAFKSCYMLNKIVLPKSIESINESAFESCYELRQIIYKGTTKEFIDNVKPTTNMFYDTATETINCADGDVDFDSDGDVIVKGRT